LYIYFEVL